MTVLSVDRLIDCLTTDSGGCNFANWPGTLEGLGLPGLYAWWADREASQLISLRLGASVEAGIVYAGQAGAGQSTATLASRIGGNHIGGKIRNSTFRLTMAAVMLESIKPHICGDRAIGHDGERILQGWLASHFRVTVLPFADRESLAQAEMQILGQLDPPLNLKGMESSIARSELSRRRNILRGASSVPSHIDLRPCRDPRGGDVSKSFSRLAKSVTLHEEIAEILREDDNRWQTTEEIAAVVNERGFYRKRDGSPVKAFQIHGRTRNYSIMFERVGNRVRLHIH